MTCFFPVDLILYSLIFVAGPFLSLNRINLAKSGDFGLFRRKTGQGIKRFPKYSPKRPIPRIDVPLIAHQKLTLFLVLELRNAIFLPARIFGFLAADVSSTADDVSLLMSAVGPGTDVTWWGAHI